MSSPVSNNPLSAPAMPPLAEAPIAPKRHTYGQILKSSALIGGSSSLNLLIGILRNKAMALLLGTSGVGLLGVLGSIADVVQSIAGMGVNSSGVRQIAAAVGSGDEARIARTAIVLRRVSFLLGLTGVVLLVALCKPISRLTFGSDEYTLAVALLAVVVFLRLVSAGQAALVQGMRRIADLARMGVAGALLGTVLSIVIVFFLRERGMVPALIAIAGMTLLTSWWYSRRVPIQNLRVTLAQTWGETSRLLKLGAAFMASGFMLLGVAYAVRTLVLRTVDSDAAGLYQSAWALGGQYVGMILQAMAADFYPRLTAIATDNPECNRTVNEQARVSLLLAGPGILATLTFAPLVIVLFYSADFGRAAELLRWICLGATLQVITWPMGFIILAKAEQKIFFLTELAWAIVHITLAYVCIRKFGLNGAGMAFFGSYVFHCCVIYPIVRRLSGFRWAAENIKTALLFLSVIGVVFGGFYVLPRWWATGLGAVATLLCGIYSVRVLLHLVPMNRIPLPLRRWIVRLNLAPASWNSEPSASDSTPPENR